MSSEFHSLVQDFKAYLVKEMGTPQKKHPEPPKPVYKPVQMAAPPVKRDPPRAPEPPKVVEAPVTLEPFRAETLSEREKMLALIRRVCPTFPLVDEIPTFEEILLPVLFLYSSEEEKEFLSKVAHALEERGIKTLLSPTPLDKVRLTVAAKSVACEAEIRLEEIALYKQDAQLKRALWEALKARLGISK